VWFLVRKNIMSAIGDITTLLDRIPMWKRLAALPAEVEALRARVAALEEEVRKRPSVEQCPICEGGILKITTVRPDPIMGVLGVQERTIKCDKCGHTEKRQHDPRQAAA
jgi:hypothetical protein